MFESPLIGVAVLFLLGVGVVALQRLEFLSVFSRRRRRGPRAGGEAGGTPE